MLKSAETEEYNNTVNTDTHDTENIKEVKNVSFYGKNIPRDSYRLSAG